MNHSFWTRIGIELVLLIVYMTIFFIVARARKRLDTVDIAWGLGFVLVVWTIVLQTSNIRTLLVAILVSVWGLRLASHIYIRSKSRGDDRRYLELSKKWRGNFWLRAYLSIFLIQGFLILIVGLPLILSPEHELSGWSWLSYLGVLIWLVGFLCEGVADRQLSEFLLQKNRPKLLSTGLWRYSRHPNYFGELLQWWGITVIILQVSYGWWGLVGPLTLSFLIIFVSGIPPIERHRAGDPDYQRYKQKTSALILLPPRHQHN